MGRSVDWLTNNKLSWHNMPRLLGIGSVRIFWNLATSWPNPGKETITKLAISKEETTSPTKMIFEKAILPFSMSVYSDEYLNQIDLGWCQTNDQHVLSSAQLNLSKSILEKGSSPLEHNWTWMPLLLRRHCESHMKPSKPSKLKGFWLK